MKKFFWMSVVGACVALVTAQMATAAPFNASFKITNVTGDCTVKAPGESNARAAEEGKSYPYGSVLRTGRKSSVLVTFSEGNTCRVLANASLTIRENTKDKKLKRLALDQGKIDITLEEDFHKNNGLEVETATAICGAIGCHFSVGVKVEGDLTVVGVICKEGKILINGKYFDIPILKDGDVLSIMTSQEKNYVRLKNVNGKFSIDVDGPNGNPRTVELEKGATIKIAITESPTEDKLIMTVLVVAPDGKELLASWTVEIPTSKPPKPPNEPATTTTTSTTTTTILSTSTTVPSPTPVGDR